MTARVLIVVTNVAHYADGDHPTGLWLSELSNAWDAVAEHGFEQTLISPAGAAVPLEPRSLKFPNFDRSAKAWHNDPDRMALLQRTASPDEVCAADFDAIYFTGGHAVIFDFPNSEGVERLTREIFEAGGVVGAVCHGYCGLPNTRLTDGSLLIDGRKLTGFAWQEEVLAGVDKLVPFNAVATAKERGAEYSKAVLPFVSYCVVDGRLVTGQNPGSAKETAQPVASLL